MTAEQKSEAYSDDLKKILISSIPEMPLDEDRLQATLHAATRRAGFPQTGFRRRVALASAAAATVLLLAAAGYWQWSGRNSDEELTFAAAIQVSGSPGEYTFGNVRAAAGKLWRDATAVLPVLMKQGAFTPAMRAELLQCIDNPQQVTNPSGAQFELLRLKLTNGMSLTPTEVLDMVDTLKVGIAAIQRTATFDPKHAEYATIMCRRLRAQVTPEKDQKRD